MTQGFMNKAVTWTELKTKAAKGLDMDYQRYNEFCQIFVIEGSTKFYVNLFHIGLDRTVIGKSPTNDADFIDFETNFKPGIDASPPSLVQPVDLPKNMKMNGKISFHESSRPDTFDKPLITVWAGSGDDVTNHIIWGGDMLAFDLTPGVSSKTVDIKFDPIFGDVWIHEAYGMWENAGFGDYVNAYTIAPPCPLQPFVNKDFIIVDNKVLYSMSGPGTGTHGFAGNPAPVENMTRTGTWDYSDETGLVPNFTGTGKYDIWTVEKISNQFISKVPVAGTTYSYVMLQSADSAKLIFPFFLRVVAHNITNTTWKMWLFLTVYREKTKQV
jgi:hypothetical protein